MSRYLAQEEVSSFKANIVNVNSSLSLHYWCYWISTFKRGWL